MTLQSRQTSNLILRTFPDGLGFSLPSVSPDCLATISYLQYVCQSSNINWTLVKDSESSRAKSLDPVLICICGEEVPGLTNIFRHMKTCPSLGNESSLDDWMNEDESADCEAWMSLALSTGKELVDLYLYVTSTNYFSTTRPAYARIFPLHVNYITPPTLRKLAIARTEHLGLQDTLKSSTEEEDEGRSVKVQNNASMIPDQLNIGRRKNELSASQKRFQLERLVNRSVGPFAELLGDKDFIMSNDRPCSLDAVILGFYGLILDAKVSDAWAANIIREKYPTLARWVETNSRKVFSLS